MTEPDETDGTPARGPSRRVAAIVGLVVGIVMVVVGVLRLLGVGAHPPPADSREALDADAGIVRQQQAERDVQAYVQANDPSIGPTDSVLVTCSPKTDVTMSCTVLVTGDGMQTDFLTVRMGMDGTWVPVDR